MELYTILHEWIVPNQQPQGFFRVILGVILTSAQSEKPEQTHTWKSTNYTFEVDRTKPE